MAIEAVKSYFKQFGKEQDVFEHGQSTATVQEAAAALGVHPARIAKTLSFKVEDSAILVVAAGDVKIDNAKYKGQFGVKAKMLSPDEVLEYTGHAIGGVCPFALATTIPVYLDDSLKRFETVFPACGSSNSSIQLNLEELFKYSNAEAWVAVSKEWDETLTA